MSEFPFTDCDALRLSIFIFLQLSILIVGKVMVTL